MQRALALIAALAQMSALGWTTRHDPSPPASAALARAGGPPAAAHAVNTREPRGRFAAAPAADKALWQRRTARRGPGASRRPAVAARSTVPAPSPDRFQAPPLILRI